MTDRLETMAGNSEQVVNRTVDREETLDLHCRVESTHVTFLLTSALVGGFGPVVLVPAGSMGHGWEDLPVRRLTAPKLVGDESRRRPLPLL